MKKAKLPISRPAAGILLALTLSLVAAPRPGNPQTSQRPQAGGLRIVDLEGTPYEMGLAHGRTLRNEIRELVGRWKADLVQTFGVPAAAFIRNFLEKTDFRPAIERWTPGLIDEVRGIADGSGLDFDTIYVFQLIDEVWAMDGDLGLPKCTSIAAGPRKGAPSFVAQTLDIPTFYHGYQTVLRIKEGNDLETLVFTIPGVISANGLNNRSVGVCVNAVTQLAYSSKGLPVAFVIRGILRQRSFEQAVRFLEEVQPAAPQNYLIGGPSEAAGFERSAGKMSRFVPFSGAEFTYHTNHPLANDDFNPRFPESLKKSNTTLEKYKTHCSRFNFLSRRLMDNSAATDLPALKDLFRDHASGINNGQTYGCTIMILGHDPELHIAPGRPDEEPFQVLGFAPRRAR